MKRYAARARSDRGTFSSLSSSIVAAQQGRRAGPTRLNIDKVADSVYVAHLRCEAGLDLIAMSADLDRDLGAVTDFEDQSLTLRCVGNGAPAPQADALAHVWV